MFTIFSGRMILLLVKLSVTMYTIFSGRMILLLVKLSVTMFTIFSGRMILLLVKLSVKIALKVWLKQHLTVEELRVFSRDLRCNIMRLVPGFWNGRVTKIGYYRVSVNTTVRVRNVKVEMITSHEIIVIGYWLNSILKIST